MKTVDLRATAGAWTTSAFPARNQHGAPTLYLSSGTIRRAFVWWARPVPLGATVISATLRLTFGNGWTGDSFHLEVFRITAGWKSSKVTSHNQPAVDTVDGGDDLSGISQFDTREIDVTALIQAVADGAAWYGLRLGVSTGAGGNDQVVFGPRSLNQDRRPELLIEYVIAPAVPTNLRPSSGHFVAVAQPALAWDFSSADPAAVQARSQVQVSTDPAFATTFYDSGWQTNPLPQWTVGSALSSSVLYYWRVRVEDSGGQQSDWSDVVSFEYAARATVAITYPAADDDVIPDSTPTITHTVSGGTQTRAEWILLDDDGNVLWDSGELATAELEQTIPIGFIVLDDVPYTVAVRVWDAIDREATPGQPTYSEARRRFTYSPTAAVLGVAALTATPRQDPGIDLVWRYTGGAEAFALVVDGEIVADMIRPDELEHAPPNDYLLTYWRAAPGLEHTFEVRAIVDDSGVLKHSSANPVVTLDSSLAFVWIFRPSTGEAIPVFGGAEPDMTVGEDATVYNPIGRAEPLIGQTSLRGYEATLDGFLLDAPELGGTAEQYRALLESWIALANTDELRIAFGPYNLPVVLPPGKHLPARRSGGYSISIPFAQAGEAFSR